MDYSEEQKERMYAGVLDHIAKSMQEEDIQAQITTKTIHRLVNMELNEDIVIENRKSLNDEYGYLASAYGFNDFHDFYLYAMSCEEQEPLTKSNGGGKSKSKDLSKLKQVKRTVTRNGKPTEMTFYEDPNKDDGGSQSQGGGEEEEDTSPQPVESKELMKIDIGKVDKKISTEDLKALNKLHASMQGQKPFDADASKYNVLTDENNNVMGIIGFDYEDEFVTIKFSDNHAFVKNFDIRLFFELAKEALRVGKGIKTKHLGTETFDIMVKEHDMEIPETQDGDYTLDKDSLFGVYGYDI